MAYASQQPFQIPRGNVCRSFPQIPSNHVPPGLEAIYSACLRIYPSQPNPKQVAARRKVWLGGTNPLDYISIYWNSVHGGHSPDHWHYVGMGLSDLHGDGRVFPMKLCPEMWQESGYGFEFTFRLKKEGEDGVPPMWPAVMLETLARMVRNSRQKICIGDIIPWRTPLDGKSRGVKVKHILLTEDPQLRRIQSPIGSVVFIQVVGICEEEAKKVEAWNSTGIVDLLKSRRETGGQLLVTDLHRNYSIFDLDIKLREFADKGIELQGSDLNGVTCRCAWNSWVPETDRPGTVCSGDFGKMKASESVGGSMPLEDCRPLRLNAVEVKLNWEAASYLSVMIFGRLKHGRLFTFTDVLADGVLITFMPSGVEGSPASKENPYVAKGKWLYVFTDDLKPMLERFLQKLKREKEEGRCSVSESWNMLGFKIQVLNCEAA